MNAAAIAIYGVLLAGVILFQLALIVGAPWGRLTQGGRNQGALPAAGRVAAAASVAVLGLMAAGVGSAAGYFPQWAAWTGYAALAVHAASMLANWATPSKPERLLWGPINTVLCGLAAYVVLF